MALIDVQEWDFSYDASEWFAKFNRAARDSNPSNKCKLCSHQASIHIALAGRCESPSCGCPEFTSC